MRLAVVVVACVVLSGCVVLPYATPPIEYAGSIGLASESNDVHLAVPVRGTIYPAGLIEQLYDRNWDIGAGYQLLLPIKAPLLHGPSASFGYYENYPTSDAPLTAKWRVGAQGMPGLAFNAETGEYGLSVGARVTGEYVGWAEGPFSSCGSADGCVIGYAYGESSVGLFGEVSYWNVDPQVWTVTFGLLLRAPATAGILLAWIWN